MQKLCKRRKERSKQRSKPELMRKNEPPFVNKSRKKLFVFNLFCQNMGYFCSFCTKIEEEVPLIELSSNLLFIGKSHYDFTFVFYELFKIVSEFYRILDKIFFVEFITCCFKIYSSFSINVFAQIYD